MIFQSMVLDHAFFFAKRRTKGSKGRRTRGRTREEIYFQILEVVFYIQFNNERVYIPLIGSINTMGGLT